MYWKSCQHFCDSMWLYCGSSENPARGDAQLSEDDAPTIGQNARFLSVSHNIFIKYQPSFIHESNKCTTQTSWKFMEGMKDRWIGGWRLFPRVILKWKKKFPQSTEESVGVDLFSRTLLTHRVVTGCYQISSVLWQNTWFNNTRSVYEWFSGKINNILKQFLLYTPSFKCTRCQNTIVV